MLCPSECAFPFIAHYVNENKIKNKDTVTGEIKQETKAINLPRNPACPPVALTCVILDKQVQRLRQKCHMNPQRIFITKRSKEKKKESSDEQDDGI